MEWNELLPRIARGRTDLIVALLSTPASAARVYDGLSLLQWAAYYGDVTAIRLLLQNGARLDDMGSNFDLNGAAFHGHWQLCQFLIENGADARIADPVTGETALHSALTNEDRLRYDLVVKVLLVAGADPNARTADGVPTGAFMRDCRTRGESPLHRAAAFGQTSTIQMLLEAGAYRRQRDARGDTALSWASWYRRPPELLRLLLFEGQSIHPDYRPMRESLLGSP